MNLKYQISPQPNTDIPKESERTKPIWLEEGIPNKVEKCECKNKKENE